ncbi:MAG: bifunctional nuclease family protein [Candidatus Latescibacterota bacterium]|nr:bifunctional nuclease family protein [Candidatus Latescibacterota bacterium]
MEVSGVYNSSPQSSYPQVVLKEVDGPGHLPIIIGRFEAAAISMAQSDQKPARPISYDLAQQILLGVHSSITKVEITDLHESTYYAEIHLVDEDGGQHVLDARPSDAIALALRFDAPIYAAAQIVEEAGFQKAVEMPPETTLAADQDREPEAPECEGKELRSVSAVKAEPPNELEQLRRRLEQAIAEEVYEEAARLRDEINRRENQE